MEIEYSLDKISSAATNFLSQVKGHRILTFSGELGAGKTTFISNLCAIFGVKQIVNSPTFSIVQQYDSDKGNIYHMDFYRIKDEEEAINAGLSDCIESGDICLIEWPENAPGILPEDTVFTRIIIIGPDRRKLQIQIP